MRSTLLRSSNHRKALNKFCVRAKGTNATLRPRLSRHETSTLSKSGSSKESAVKTSQIRDESSRDEQIFDGPSEKGDGSEIQSVRSKIKWYVDDGLTQRGRRRREEKSRLSDGDRSDTKAQLVPSSGSQLGALSDYEQISGSQGVARWLIEMKKAKQDLLLEGEDAKIIWTKLRAQTETYEELFEYAVDYRARTGIVVPWLYRDIVGWSLTKASNIAWLWHWRFVEQYVLPADALKAIAGVAAKHVESLQLFRKIYAASNQRNCYDTLMPLLTKSFPRDAALEWHAFLIEHRDWPSQSAGIATNSSNFTPQQAINDLNHDMTFVNNAMLFTSRQPWNDSGRSRHTSQFVEVRSRSHGCEETPMPELNESFGSRLFATSAIPVKLAISGLLAFQVKVIGPLALRQLALRVKNGGGLISIAGELQKAGVVLRDCVFTHALLKLAQSNRPQLYYLLLNSDQHPENLDDYSLQVLLFQQMVNRQSWPDAHLILYILSNFHSSPNTHTWNALVQTQASRTWPDLLSTLGSLEAKQQHLSPYTLSVILRHKLKPRQAGERPALHQDFDDAMKVANLFKNLASAGQPIEPYRWTEIIKRIGMCGKWHEVSHLLIWLAQHYSFAEETTALLPPPPHSVGSGENHESAVIDPVPSSAVSHDADIPYWTLFGPIRQASIVQWGFQYGFGRQLEAELKRFAVQQDKSAGNERTLEYNHSHLGISDDDLPNPTSFPLSGITLLKQLHEIGVPMLRSSIRQALRDKLWQLYSPFEVSTKLINRRARQINPWTLEEMVHYITELDNTDLSQDMSAAPHFDEVRGLLEAPTPMGKSENTSKDLSTAEATYIPNDFRGDKDHDGGVLRNARGTLSKRMQKPLLDQLYQIPDANSEAAATLEGSHLGDYAGMQGAVSAVQDTDNFDSSNETAEDNNFPRLLPAGCKSLAMQIRAYDGLIHQQRQRDGQVDIGPSIPSLREWQHLRARLALLVFGKNRVDRGVHFYRRIGRRGRTLEMADFERLARSWPTSAGQRKQALAAISKPRVRSVSRPRSIAGYRASRAKVSASWTGAFPLSSHEGY